MIAKAGFAAVVVMTAIVSGRSVDLRGLYDQMYPVSTLKRDALDLCHESDPSFIRAVHGDREACYSAMPHAIAMALGLVRPDSALAGLFEPMGTAFGTGAALADTALGSWAASVRQPPLTSRLAIGDRGPCGGRAAELSAIPANRIDTTAALDVLASRGGSAAGDPLKRLGLPDRGAAPPSAAQPAQGGGLALLDTTGTADLGDPAADTARATGCAAKI